MQFFCILKKFYCTIAKFLGLDFHIFSICFAQQFTFVILEVCLIVSGFCRIQDTRDVAGAWRVRSQYFLAIALRHTRPVNGIWTNKFPFNKFDKLIASIITH